MKNSTVKALVVILTILTGTMCMLSSITIDGASAQTENRRPVNINISQVGVRVVNSAAEFGPLTIGTAFVNNTGSSNTVYFSADKVLRYSDPKIFHLDTSKLMTGRMNITLKNSSIVLSDKIQTTKSINYFGVSFKTISISNPKDNHAGVVWNVGNKQYYAFLRPDRLIAYTPAGGELSSVPAVHPIGKWETLIVAYIDGYAHIFLNNEDRIQFKAGITTTAAAPSDQLKATTKDTTTSSECGSSAIFFLSCK